MLNVTLECPENIFCFKYTHTGIDVYILIKDKVIYPNASNFFQSIFQEIPYRKFVFLE